ncbi:MAG TPA: hypothetical protein VJI13_02280 [Candidatus Norongarragalinales archaeon]|nr:hypothetical protein [Candidatus Norongarragalinales archaeon]
MREDKLSRIQEKMDALERQLGEVRAASFATLFIVAVLFALILGAIVKIFLG